MKQNLRIPGPTPCPEEVLLAGAQPMINHRGPEFRELDENGARVQRAALVVRNAMLSALRRRVWEPAELDAVYKRANDRCIDGLLHRVRVACQLRSEPVRPPPTFVETRARLVFYNYPSTASVLSYGVRAADEDDVIGNRNGEANFDHLRPNGNCPA